MYGKILLATDGSPSAEEATKYALKLAKLVKGEITAVSVLYSALKFPKSRKEVEEEQRKKAEETFLKIKELGEKEDIKVDSKILRGPPWTMIVEEAGKGYDIIIMGSKGEGALGSVAEKVVRDARCPVLVCKT
jgi:nucleotide-binding universal stress UspA family protein